MERATLGNIRNGDAVIFAPEFGTLRHLAGRATVKATHDGVTLVSRNVETDGAIFWTPLDDVYVL